MTTEIEILRRIEEREARDVANGICFRWEIELCLPDIGCNETVVRVARDRSEAIRIGRRYAATMNIRPAAIRARKV